MLGVAIGILVGQPSPPVEDEDIPEGFAAVTFDGAPVMFDGEPVYAPE